MCVIAEDRQSQKHSARSLAQPATATQDLDIFALLSSIEPADHKPVKPLPALRYLHPGLRCHPRSSLLRRIALAGAWVQVARARNQPAGGADSFRHPELVWLP